MNLFLIASTAASCSYFLFYYFSPFIWSLNSTLPVNEYTPWVGVGISGQSGGIQVYVLYLLMFFSLGLSFILNAVFSNIKELFLRKIFIILSLVLSFVFFISIRFNVPMAVPATTLPEFMFVGAVFLVTIFLSLNHKSWWVPIIVFLSLLALCLITATSVSRIDYTWILAPAWRVLHGFGLKETFFLYDYLLSLLAAGWIKFFPIETISLLGRLSYFALFFGAYLFAKRFFNNKQLASCLLISMVIVKVYGNIVPPDGVFQVIPLRLDWWLVVLALAYWKAAHHWIVAAILGFLIIFHHSFGCIYTISYFIFILMLIILEIAVGKGLLGDILKKYLFLYLRNIIFILTSFLIYSVFLQPPMDIAVYFQRTGLGFMRIDTVSFYWYMPVIFAAAFLLLCKKQSLLSQKYFETSIFLLSLAIGNSMYFFGRSHENNIINIAAVLLMVFFLLLDLVYVELKQLSSKEFSQWAVLLMAGAAILMISYQYAGRAVRLLDVQSANLKNHSFVASSFSDFESLDFAPLRTLTHSSPKVIFISQQDFFFYYFGKYPLPQNYHSSMCSWFIMKEYVNYLNDQLAQGFYIVVNPQEINGNRSIMNSLKARYFSNTADLLVFSNNPLREFDKTLWYR